MWFGFALFIPGGAFMLWRILRRGSVKQYGAVFTRKDDPFTFWFVVFLLILAEIWFIGMLVLVVISLINGPIVDQSKCPAAHGWWKALNCPSVDANGAYVPRGRG
jgi:hypothetical protein